MSKPIYNPNAFPVSAYTAQRINEGYGAYDEELGMTLRDYFAAKALITMLDAPTANLIDSTDDTLKTLAKHCYMVADAMLEERVKTDKS